MFRCAAMSLLWSCAAFVSFALSFSGEQPALLRSLLTSLRMLAAAPEAGALLGAALGEGAAAGFWVVPALGLVCHPALPEWWWRWWPFPCHFPWPQWASSGPFRHAMAAVGTASALTARAPMAIFR